MAPEAEFNRGLSAIERGAMQRSVPIRLEKAGEMSIEFQTSLAPIINKPIHFTNAKIAKFTDFAFPIRPDLPILRLLDISVSHALGIIVAIIVREENYGLLLG